MLRQGISTVGVLGALALLPACAHDAVPAAAPPAPPSAEAPQLSNVLPVVPGIISGSAPATDADYRRLASMGIRTIISVDGSSPDPAAARAEGMRYVHIPVEYAGITPDEEAAIARAVRDLPGPVYIHCHHGKHRGPAAAALAAIALGEMTPAQGVAFLERAGTSPAYPGLFACVRRADALDSATLDAAPADFPEVAPTPGFVQAMVRIDGLFDRLGRIRDAGWKAPADHPDLAPVAEAGRLVDLLRALKQDPLARSNGPQFLDLLAQSADSALALEDALAGRAGAPALDDRLRAVGASCRACHEPYRDHR